MERLRTEGVVDVFQFIKCARVQRAHFVPQCVSFMKNESLNKYLFNVLQNRLQHSLDELCKGIVYTSEKW